ncbi:PR5-like receptor kinase [Quercus robur]|uniref:PR5-like receptor kinase n=1 Tax=Quercus robur TaxID=38942 RepID=UPI002161261E|nr:PR5-like receptor kinase [Quercus robur]
MVTGSISAGGTAIIVIIFLIICTLRRKHLSSNAIVCWKKHARKDQDAEEIIKNYESLAPKRYTYSDVKKLTNSFKDKIGQGGYGAVYKGKLPNGHIEAVKVLTNSKGNGEEFINEVASISKTSHVNIVTLLGFCHEGTKRALIYEFMPKGSLDTYIYNQGLPDINCHLEWNTIHQIAIGIARGLEYLHRGCSTRILHFDIKPHNILLDEDFCPKISDFGLAKLCQRKESIVSMTGVRGTAGYMAPEVFSRNFGGVSHKSDVYSYGMLVFEMVGGRKNFDAGVSHTSEIYFPHWIYKKLELKENVSICEEMSEQEEETTKKMMIVSLWCIQTNPLDRPSMGKVIEMLEGTLQSLEFPPKPFLDSPRRSPQDSSKM